MKDFKNKNILFITHTYFAFEKDQIETLSKYFNKVYVVVRYKPISEIASILPISSLKPHMYKNCVDETNLPNNVTLFIAPLYYLPFNYCYKKLGEIHLKKTLQIIKKNNITFDIVHGQFSWTGGYVAVKLKEIYKVPAIVTAHGGDVYEYPFIDEEWRSNTSYVFNNCDALITVSHKNKKILDELNVQSPIYVIPNGYNKSQFKAIDKTQARKKHNLPSDNKIIITVGHLEIVKGHIYLIKAIKELKDSYNSINKFLFIIVGDGSQMPTLKKLSKELRLEKNIVFLGHIPHHTIPELISAADLFVLPSLNEGNPTVMFESLGCGIPFISTNVGGVKEIINSDLYGFTCPPKNSTELANTILKGLSKEWDSSEIKKYSQNFTWENISEKIIEIYLRL